jgi:hypothetical protein
VVDMESSQSLFALEGVPGHAHLEVAGGSVIFKIVELLCSTTGYELNDVQNKLTRPS